MRLKKLVLLVVLAGSTACAIGKNAAAWDVAKRPYGAAVTLRTASTSFIAELIEVMPDGVVVKGQNGKLIFAPYSVIEDLSAQRLGSAYRFGRRIPPAPAVRANLVTVSHFPQGMTPEIRRKMLASTGQAEVEILR